MAREQAITTLEASRFVQGYPITAADKVAIIKQANFAYGHRPQVHASLVTAPRDWASGSPATLKISFRSAATAFEEVLRFRIRILPETVNVVVGAECNMGAADTGDVEFTINEAIPTLVAANQAKLEASKAGSHLATSLKRAGFLVDVPEEGTEKTASIVMALQAPVALAIDAGLISEIRTYFKALAMSTAAPDIIARVGIKFERETDKFDERLRQYAGELEQATAGTTTT